MALPFGIDRSTLAGGLSGLAVWGIGLGLTAMGIVVPVGVVSGLVAILVPVVVHFVPDAAKVDAEIKKVATLIPVVEDTYPNPSVAPTPSNINRP